MSLTKIYSVDDLAVSLIKTSPPALVIVAHGRVTSSGWSGGVLSQYIYLNPPQDGIQAFDFLAEPPPADAVVVPELALIKAEIVLQDLDIANYWGPGVPLLGVRVHAIENSKLSTFADQQEMTRIRALEQAGIAPGSAPASAAPGFAKDIKPLFRNSDAAIMLAVSGFDLHNYDDVKKHSARILQTLETGSMPCDGRWPQGDIDLFSAWIAADMPA